MIDIKIITIDKDKIISLEINKTIYSIGDIVDLDFKIKKGFFDGYIIEEFQLEEGGNRHFPSYKFPKFTIVTNKGCISPDYVAHVDYNSELYILNNKPCLSIVDIFSIFGEKKHKKLLELVKNKKI